MSFTAAEITLGGFLDWMALMIVAAAVFFSIARAKARHSRSRRGEFLARFKATREWKRFREDMEKRDK